MMMSSRTAVNPASANDRPSRHMFRSRNRSCTAASSDTSRSSGHNAPDTIIFCSTSALDVHAAPNRRASAAATVVLPAPCMPEMTMMRPTVLDVQPLMGPRYKIEERATDVIDSSHEDGQEEARALLDLLPDDASMDDIMEGLYFNASVLRGLKQAERGEVVSDDEARKLLGKWLKSSGQETRSSA